MRNLPSCAEVVGGKRASGLPILLRLRGQDSQSRTRGEPSAKGRKCPPRTDGYRCKRQSKCTQTPRSPQMVQIVPSRAFIRGLIGCRAAQSIGRIKKTPISIDDNLRHDDKSIAMAHRAIEIADTTANQRLIPPPFSAPPHPHPTRPRHASHIKRSSSGDGRGE